MEGKILKICRYQERFELPKNMGGLCVSKGLEFFRYFCDSDKPEAKLYFNQIGRLRAFNNHLAIECLYLRLVAWASRYTKTHRGYVYAFEYLADDPAGVADIALSVGLSVDECTAYLQCLIDTRLVEWVYATEAHGGQGRPLQASPEAGSYPTEAPLDSEPPPGGPPGVAGIPPGEPTDNGLNGPTVSNKTNDQRSNGQRSTPAAQGNAQPQTSPLTGQDRNEANESVPSKPPPDKPAASVTQADEMLAWQERKKAELEQRASAEQVTPTPENVQSPVSPTKSDAGSGDQRGTSPPLSCGGLPKTDHRRNPDICEAHWTQAVRVFKLLRMPQPEGSDAWKDEVSSFSSKIQKAGAWPDAVEKSMKKAMKLGRDDKLDTPNRARIWHSTLTKRIAAREQRQQSRARKQP